MNMIISYYSALYGWYLLEGYQPYMVYIKAKFMVVKLIDAYNLKKKNMFGISFFFASNVINIKHA